MSKKLIGLFTAKFNVGCTFLDWSIHFLNGRRNNYNLTNGYMPLVDNPLTDKNAHIHNKNHLRSFELNKKYIDKFLSTDIDDFVIVYPSLIHGGKVVDRLGIDYSEQLSKEDLKKVTDYQYQDLLEVWKYLQNQNSKLIYLEDDPRLKIFHQVNKRVNTTFVASELTFSNHNQEQQDLFFKKSIKDWQQLNLNEIWDQRERLALNSRPMLENISRPMPRDNSNLTISSYEWLLHGKTTIKKIMDYCNLSIDSSRFDDWVKVYHQWQLILEPFLLFDYQLPIIVDSIVNNYYYELPELSLYQEALIQHFLIYKHNLNLKTWQLSKFPRNTQDLHKLLESNIHPIEDIYNIRSTT